MKGPSAAELAAGIERENLRGGNYGKRYELEREHRERRQPPEHVHQPDREERMLFRDPANPSKPFVLEGAPGSKERMAQARRYAGDAVADQVEKERRVQELGQLLQAYASSERDDLDEHVGTELARGVLELDDPYLYAAARESLEELGAYGVLERLDETVVQTVQGAEQESRIAATANRHALLQSELDRLPGPDAEQVAAMMNADPGAFYGDDELNVKVAARTVGEQSRASRRALDTFGIAAGINEELKQGIGRPGTRWTDEERAAWEAGQDDSVMRTTERATEQASPEAAFERAASSVVNDGKPSPGLQALHGELAKLSKTDEQLAEETERSKRVFPEKWKGAGEEGSLGDRQPEVTGLGTWEA